MISDRKDTRRTTQAAHAGWEAKRFPEIPCASWRAAGRVLRNFCFALILLGGVALGAPASFEASNRSTAASGSPGSVPKPQMLRVVRRADGPTLRFFVENLEAADVTATFSLGLSNLKSTTRFPLTATFAPHQMVEAFDLSPVRGDEEWHYTLTNNYTIGSNRAVHDDSFVYSLPYAAGHAYRVSQGYNGTFSHTGPERYAIDWQMPQGTPVLAARGGTVVATKADSSIGGPDRKFENDANYVLIEQSDGTIGNYAHLLKGGINVHVGQRVEAGDQIALSGNTGFSSGPHLHFSVFRARNGKERESIPTRFRTSDGVELGLLQDWVYRAPAALVAASQRRNERLPD